MLFVGAVEHLAANALGFDDTGLGELAKLLPELAGGGLELGGHFPQVGAVAGAEEQAHEDLHPPFGGDDAGEYVLFFST